VRKLTANSELSTKLSLTERCDGLNASKKFSAGGINVADAESHSCLNLFRAERSIYLERSHAALADDACLEKKTPCPIVYRFKNGIAIERTDCEELVAR
jgi:hypothetical protein